MVLSVVALVYTALTSKRVGKPELIRSPHGSFKPERPLPGEPGAERGHRRAAGQGCHSPGGGAEICGIRGVHTIGLVVRGRCNWLVNEIEGRKRPPAKSFFRCNSLDYCWAFFRSFLALRHPLDHCGHTSSFRRTWPAGDGQSTFHESAERLQLTHRPLSP